MAVDNINTVDKYIPIPVPISMYIHMHKHKYICMTDKSI